MENEDLKFTKTKLPNPLVIIPKNIKNSNLLVRYHKIEEQFRKTFFQNQKFNLAITQLEESVKPIKEVISTTLKNFNSALPSEFFDRFKSIQKIIGQAAVKWGPVFEKFQRLPGEYRRVHMYLAERGWLTNSSFPVSHYSGILNLMKMQKEDEIESLMIKFTRGECEEIEMSITNSWLNRRGILQDAFEAHRQSKYSLSIPVMLAQIDGICFDLFDISFYKDVEKLSKRIKKLRESEKEKGNWYQELIFDLMIMENPIRESTNVQNRKKRSRMANATLSRHGVLHGRYTDYATEANSLRCILIFGYLEFLKQDLIECS